jgi:hypothetical protein
MSFYETNKYNLQQSIVDYYGNCVMIKVRDYQESYSLYYAKMINLVYSDDKYIIAIVQKDYFPVGTKKHLSELNWISFQTRVIDTLSYPVRSQNIKSKITTPVLDKIHLSQKNEDRYVYTSDSYPVEIELLLTEKDDSYASQGTIQGALDTYNCVIRFLF